VTISLESTAEIGITGDPSVLSPILIVLLPYHRIIIARVFLRIGFVLPSGWLLT